MAHGPGKKSLDLGDNLNHVILDYGSGVVMVTDSLGSPPYSACEHVSYPPFV